MSKLDRISDFHIWLALAIIITVSGLVIFTQTEYKMRENHKEIIILQDKATNLYERYDILKFRIESLEIK